MKTINSVISFLDKTCERIPDRIAIQYAEESYTFARLRTLSLAVASRLLKEECMGRNICILLPKCPEAIISFFGCLYSANTYVPLDYNDAEERILRIISKVSSPLVITDVRNANRLAEKGIKTLVYTEIDMEQIDENVIYGALEGVYDLMPAYIMHTSGSTGDPKGVVVHHRGISDFILWITGYMNLNESSTIALQSPFHFDASVFDIYSCIAVGAKIVIMPDVLAKFPAKIPEFIEDNHITCIFWVPGILADIANSGALSKYPMKELKLFTFIGEVMPTRQLNMWIKANPNREYINLYGPTEATVACTAYRITEHLADTDSIPIGRASCNKKILILTEDNTLAATGETGEICIGGSGLALGYYGEKELTERAFVQNPLNPEYEDIIYRTGDFGYVNENGDIVFSGRKDAQVKVHGIRVELGDIENAACILEGVERSCAMLGDEGQLLLFLQTKSRSSQRQLKQALKEHLPKYMIPDVIYEVDTFPVNKNGKIDRRQLIKTIG